MKPNQSSLSRIQSFQEVVGARKPWRRRVLRFLLTSWRRRLLILAATVTLLVLLSDPLYRLYITIRDSAISSTGLGLVPVSLFFAVTLWMAIKRRSLLVKGWNILIGSGLFVAASLMILAYWRGNQGILYDVTLGGNLGYELRGISPYYGAFRLVPLILAGLLITFPRRTPLVTMKTGRLLIAAAKLSVAYSGRALTFSKWAFITGYTYMALALSYVPRTLGLLKGVSIAYRLPIIALARIKSVVVRTPKAPEPDTAQDSSPDSLAIPMLDLDNSDYADGTPESEPTIDEKKKRLDPPSVSSTVHTVNGENPEEPPLQSESTSSMGTPGFVKGWKMPPIGMLWEIEESSVSEEDQRVTAATIERTLGDYGIEVRVKQIKPGPTVTMYGLEPGWNRRFKEIREKDEAGQLRLGEDGRPIVSKIENKTRVKVGSIVAREKDLALALAATSIRIEAPVPGESVVGIEVPNPNPSIVTLRSVMEGDAYKKLKPKAHLPVALGKGSGGEVVVTDLTRMPHLLIAGATGSGKSVCINSIISCLLMEKSPEELRLLLIDPKRVELNFYNGIPHLLKPTVVEADEAVDLLKGLINEMFKRYREFEEVGVRNIQVYNKKSPETMPYIIVVIDELADLMMASQYEVESSVCRLAQLGRATGIHLVVATQRPSVNIVTGLIKANFPSRISFAVASQVDSRTILDSAGAEKLLGRGDMLYLPLDGLKPKRTQGVFISDQEIESLVRYWSTLQGPPVPEISLDIEEEEDDEDEFPRDQLLDKAIELANSHTRLSTSLLQRRLRIGYPRAARLMEQLEEEGVVIPGEPGKPKDVTTNWS